MGRVQTISALLLAIVLGLTGLGPAPVLARADAGAPAQGVKDPGPPVPATGATRHRDHGPATDHDPRCADCVMPALAPAPELAGASRPVGRGEPARPPAPPKARSISVRGGQARGPPAVT